VSRRTDAQQACHRAGHPGLLDPLLDASARRILATTVGLVGLLAVAMTVATMMLAVGRLQADADQALREAASEARASLMAGAMPSRGVASIQAQPHRSSSPQSGTFVLVLNPDGSLLGDPAPLAELPDQLAVAAAHSSDDIRSVTPGDVQIRLLTIRLDPPAVIDGEQVGYLQVGLIATLEEQQKRSLFLSMLLMTVIGLAGTALVGWIVTRRAMRPIQAAFERERRFVAEASHQLRTPLAVLRSSAEVLEREGRVTREGRPLVRDVIGEADRLARIVDELHALAVLQAAPRQAAELVETVGLARGAVGRARALGRARGIHVVLDSPATARGRGATAPAGGLCVEGSRRALDELLMVLLENAVRHSPDRGTVRLGVARAGSTVELTVDDQGPGIPPADRERVFEPFARLAQGTAGSGLGLAIAREIAAQHGGRVEATTAPSGGARLRATLPLATGELRSWPAASKAR
jgi:signal transduction histidine kinase